MRILKENSFDLRRTRTTLSIRKKKIVVCYVISELMSINIFDSILTQKNAICMQILDHDTKLIGIFFSISQHADFVDISTILK